MAHLGEFGRARIEQAGEPDTFTFHGDRFEVPAGISAVVLMDFVADTQASNDAREAAIERQERAQSRVAVARTEAERAVLRADVSEADADIITATNDLLRAIRAYLKSCLPDDASWQRFNHLCRRDAVEMDELMEVAGAIYAAVAGRPTRRPSDSSDGPYGTGDGSTDDAGSPAPTGGPRPPATGSPEEPLLAQVVEMTPLERQRAEARAQMRTVESLLSGG